VASFARSLNDGAAAVDGLARAAQQTRPLADGAAASDELWPYDVASIAWILGPVLDPWAIGPLVSLTT
jgi:hypothetical protein